MMRPVLIRVRVFVGSRELPLEGTDENCSERDKLFETHTLIHINSELMEHIGQQFAMRPKVRAATVQGATILNGPAVYVYENEAVPIYQGDTPASLGMRPEQERDEACDYVVSIWLPEPKAKVAVLESADAKASRLLSELQAVLPLVSDEMAASCIASLSDLQLSCGGPARTERCRCPMVEQLDPAVLDAHVQPWLGDVDVRDLAATCSHLRDALRSSLDARRAERLEVVAALAQFNISAIGRRAKKERPSKRFFVPKRVSDLSTALSLALADPAHGEQGHLEMSAAGGMVRYGVAALPAVVARCPCLVRLELQETSMDDEVLARIASRIATHAMPRLRMLELGGNPGVGDAGVSALAAALPALPNLGYLNLNGVGVGDAGVFALARALTVAARALVELELVSDGITDAGASAVASALTNGALPSGKCLFMAGAFSSADCPGPGFNSLTRACDSRGLILELDHGIPWGM